MKIKESGICCDGCFSQIAKVSTKSARLWLDLCQEYPEKGVMALLDEENESLRLLETLGFITTTDVNNLILLKVHGRKKDLMGSLFCLGNCE